MLNEQLLILQAASGIQYLDDTKASTCILYIKTSPQPLPENAHYATRVPCVMFCIICVLYVVCLSSAMGGIHHGITIGFGCSISFRALDTSLK